MSKSQDKLPLEIENQFILRLPPEHASTVRNIIHSRHVTRKDKIKIDLASDECRAVVNVEDVSLSAKLVDLPCVVGSLKTFDKKTFYKTADISQMLVCSAESGDVQSSLEGSSSTDPSETRNKERETEKKYIWKHGRWEVIADDETKEIESQGCIPGSPVSPGASGYKQVMEIQKHIRYKEKKLRDIQNKAQRQKNIIRKVENLALKNFSLLWPTSSVFGTSETNRVLCMKYFLIWALMETDT
ncbi:Transcription initiation factor TFIID subunit 7-like [Fukomys damarensis]|uniref:Transcription initiation factor TFIID subunit 7-like n=1 Tax=Fukomys damarensis TaxID=885580 RepID=A0A091DSW4_FUKDA|nr:Transcription initiation factor TFIID subunit 7-like [Fukomys damarensis]